MAGELRALRSKGAADYTAADVAYVVDHFNAYEGIDVIAAGNNEDGIALVTINTKGLNNKTMTAKALLQLESRVLRPGMPKKGDREKAEKEVAEKAEKLRSSVAFEGNVVRHPESAYVGEYLGYDHVMTGTYAIQPDDMETTTVSQPGNFAVFFGGDIEPIHFICEAGQIRTISSNEMKTVLAGLYPREAELADKIAATESQFEAVRMPKLKGTSSQVSYAEKIRRAVFAFNPEYGKFDRNDAKFWIDFHKSAVKGINTTA